MSLQYFPSNNFENTNHRHISLTASDLFGLFKFSKYIYFKSAYAHLIPYFRKFARKLKSKRSVFDGLHISCKISNRKNLSLTTKKSNLVLRLNIKSLDLIYD